jgi:hypothetical protein
MKEITKTDTLRKEFFPMRPHPGIPIYMKARATMADGRAEFHEKEIYPEFLDATRDPEVLVQPKWNGERGLYDAERDDLWNRRGCPFRGCADPSLSIIDAMQALYSKHGWRWFDLELLGGKTRTEKCAILIDVPDLRKQPLSERIMRIRNELRPMGLGGTPTPNIWNESEPRLFSMTHAIGGEGDKHFLSFIRAMEETNALLGEPLFEGVVIKYLDSEYDAGALTSNTVNANWTKYRFTRNK